MFELVSFLRVFSKFWGYFDCIFILTMGGECDKDLVAFTLAAVLVKALGYLDHLHQPPLQFSFEFIANLLNSSEQVGLGPHLHCHDLVTTRIFHLMG